MTKEEFCIYCNITENQFYGKDIINRDLDLHRVNELPIKFNPHVSGDLWITHVINLPYGFNPRVSGYLNLYNVINLPDEFNPQVGGSLNLSSVINLPNRFNPIVGKYIYLDNLKCTLLRDLVYLPGVKRELGFNLLKNI